MIATITAQSSTMMMDHPFLRNANLAGAPLPHIPRRSASTSRMPLPSFSTSPTFPASPVSICVQNPTPPDSQEKVQKTSSATAVDEDYSSSSEASSSSSSSSSSSTKLFLRPRRAIVPPLALSPPPSSTPVPVKARKESKVRTRSPPTDNESDTPRAVPFAAPARLQFDSPKQRHSSESRIADPGFKSAPAMTPPMVRKKSGQIVKSSLKLSRSAPRPGLSVFTGISSSKSEPNTPSLSKAVHFDKQLEHVKLFLAEQKPLAVSRDGSPTDDTSGTDSDFPSFIFGEPYGDKVSRQRLVMNVINMPSVVNLQADLVLETLLLSNDGTNIQGRARVRNMAFQKWLAVRFTFDAWQTTSEVTAKYVESCPDNFDVFGFTIKLNDLLARIEEKTLVLALRYSIVGREIWDNNHGRNYVAKFSRVKAAVPNRARPSANDSSSDMMDLKTKLEKVVQKRDSAESAPRLTRPKPLTVKEPILDEPIAHPLEPTLSSDTNNSPKATRISPPNDTRSRTFTYPSVSSSPIPSPPSSIPWPIKQPSQVDASKSKALGSPRDLDDFTFRPSPFVPADLEERPFAVTRNHQRGYFDIGVLPVSTLKRTPPGTPRMRSADSSTPAPRSYSFPPVDMPYFGLMLSRDVEGTTSDESTPSIVSPSSGSDQDSSPAQSPMELEYVEPMGKMPDTPNTNYHQFLNRFCFYTGTDSLEVSPDLSRSSSMSSIDDVLSASPRLPAFLQHHISTLTPRGDTGTVTPTNKQPSAVL